MEDNMSKYFWSSLAMKRVRLIFWITLFIFMVLTFYINWYMPRGEMIDMGYEVESPDYSGRGSVEKFIEDVRELDIPNWAKFLRLNVYKLVVILLFAGGLLENKIKQERY